MPPWTRPHALFSGCAAEDDGRPARRATIALARKLDVALWEAPGDGCCGARSDRAVDEQSRRDTLAPLVEGERQGLGILCLSPACRRVVADALASGRPNQAASGGAGRPVRDVLELLTAPGGADALASALVTSLTPLRVALHGVCHADHQPAGANVTTRPDAGAAIGDLTALTGAVSAGDVSVSGGCAAVPLRPDIAEHGRGEEIGAPCLELAAQGGADVLVTACFLCFGGLNHYQRSLATGAPARRVPVLHLAQLLGVACDVAASQLDLDRTAVSAQRALAAFV